MAKLLRYFAISVFCSRVLSFPWQPCSEFICDRTSSLLNCNQVLDRCHCQPDSRNKFNVTCPGLGPEPFQFATISSFWGEIEMFVTCPHQVHNLSLLLGYLTSFLRVLPIFSHLKVSGCCEQRAVTSVLNVSGLETTNVKTFAFTENCVDKIVGGEFGTVFPRVRKIDLSYNRFNSVSCAAVRTFNISTLNELSLHHNNIQNLSDCDFQFNHSDVLTLLDLSHNKIENLSDGVFRSLVKLEDLTLEENRLKRISPKTFHQANSQLMYLRLNSNNLTNITSDTFDNLTKLRFIDFSNNSLKSIPKDLFSNMRDFEAVGLGENAFTHLPEGLFKRNRFMAHVNLSHGLLKELPKIDFRLYEEYYQYSYFYASDNFITKLKIPYHSGKIEMLNLSNNCIKRVESELSNQAGPIELGYVNHMICKNCCLDSNTAARIAPTIKRRVDFTGNNISIVDMAFLRSVAHLEEVLIAGNQVRTVDVSYNYPLWRKVGEAEIRTSLLIDNNHAMVCDCRILSFLKLVANVLPEPPPGLTRTRMTFDTRNNLYCGSPPNFKGVLVTDILQNSTLVAEMKCDDATAGSK